MPWHFKLESSEMVPCREHVAVGRILTVLGPAVQIHVVPAIASCRTLRGVWVIV